MTPSELIRKNIICPECGAPINWDVSGKCQQCGLRVSVRDEKIFFTSHDAVVTKTREDYFRNTANWTYFRKLNYDYFSRHLQHLDDSSVLLDLGAGPSQFHGLTKRFRVIALDFMPYEPVDVVCDLNMKWPIQSEVVDILFASNVYEHLRDPFHAFTESARLLRRGGVILGTVPYLMKTHQKPHDYYRYTEFGLRHLLERSGFEFIEITPLGEPVRTAAQNEYHLLVELYAGLNDTASRFQRGYYFASIKLLRLCFFFIQHILYPIFKNAPASNDYTLGFGFIAKKR